MSRTDPQRVFGRLNDSIAHSERVALCQIVRVEGATAGRLGWKLAVPATGSAIGNLGGGAFEAMVVRDARLRLTESLPKCEVKRYYFTEESTRGEATGMVCGGMAEVMIEVVGARPQLVVCGGGPVGQAIVRAAELCDFDTLVVDDREEFRDADLFPADTVTRAVGREYGEDFLSDVLDRELWVAFVTRCWETDLAALRAVLRQAPSRLCYLGMMGSQRKVTRVKGELSGEVLPVDLHAPIGHRIGGETPGEIAISVLAEMIEIRRRELRERTSDGPTDAVGDRDGILAVEGVSSAL